MGGDVYDVGPCLPLRHSRILCLLEVVSTGAENLSCRETGWVTNFTGKANTSGKAGRITSARGNPISELPLLLGDLLGALFDALAGNGKGASTTDKGQDSTHFQRSRPRKRPKKSRELDARVRCQRSPAVSRRFKPHCKVKLLGEMNMAATEKLDVESCAAVGARAKPTPSPFPVILISSTSPEPTPVTLIDSSKNFQHRFRVQAGSVVDSPDSGRGQRRCFLAPAGLAPIPLNAFPFGFAIGTTPLPAFLPALVGAGLSRQQQAVSVRIGVRTMRVAQLASELCAKHSTACLHWC
eukprot:3935545-Rhodomonas_salina.7